MEMTIDAIKTTLLPEGKTFYDMGMMYATGRDCDLDMIAAHCWFNIGAAKGDREAVPPGAAPARTVQLRTDRLADTSVLVRIPVQKDARNLPPAQPAKPAKPKMTVACEPVVSVLTEVAKLLQPGRCVT